MTPAPPRAALVALLSWSATTALIACQDPQGALDPAGERPAIATLELALGAERASRDIATAHCRLITDGPHGPHLEVRAEAAALVRFDGRPKSPDLLFARLPPDLGPVERAFGPETPWHAIATMPNVELGAQEQPLLQLFASPLPPHPSRYSCRAARLADPPRISLTCNDTSVAPWQFPDLERPEGAFRVELPCEVEGG